jgi:hypothetical protein
MLNSQQADGLILRSQHLIHTGDVRKGKQHRQLAVILHQSTITGFGEAKLALDDPERMLNLGSYTGLHVFDAQQGLIDSRVLS